jgi:type I restriction enzyme, S subunit
VSFVPMSAVEAETGRMDATEIRQLGEVRGKYTSFREGDVLFAKITPSMENGKSAVAQALASKLGFGSTEFHVLRPKTGVEARFIRNYVVQKSFRRSARVHMKGTAGQLRVPADYLKEVTFPLAPTQEQGRIVTVVEEQFSRLDAGVAALERVRTNLKRYRTATLKAAVEGRLTEAWREENSDVEPASDLLKRILRERREQWENDQLAAYEKKGKKPPKNWRSKYREPLGPETRDLPELPEGWCWTAVRQIGALGEQPVLTGPFGTSLKTSDFTFTGVPVLTIGCLTSSGITFDKAAFLSDEKAADLERYRLREGDLLFSRMASVGRAGIVTPNIAGSLFNYHIMRLRLAPHAVLPGFYLAFVRGQLRSYGTYARSTMEQHETASILSNS